MCIRDRAQALWADIGAQRWDALAAYFLPGALIFWHNTDACFTAEEFVRANREYPGNWRIAVAYTHLAAIRACKGGKPEAKAAIMEKFGFDLSLIHI